MKTVIISITKIILMIIFLYIINNLVGFFFGNLIPNPDEMRGAVFIYLFIFICEMILAYLSTYMVFKIAKMEK
ncbi:MAG: hypothetical protein PWR19_1718 [Carnobacterium sp.]|jgi:hypothetical protein|uniref:hypothetical protein n=1 Tax=Carnobacterium sp. TaxID=48221 RepID=UPI0005592087|nr:hypothetical protein [Carnobacterium sp.]